MENKNTSQSRKKLTLVNSSREGIYPINNYARIDVEDASRMLLNKEDSYSYIEKF